MPLAKIQESRRVPGAIGLAIVTGLTAALMGVLTSTCTRDAGNEAEKRDLIRIITPRPGATVTSPLRVRGEARGTWFFEASFPVRLVDADGHEIAVVPAQAQGEWMTERFVPFEAVLEFSASAAGTRGTLILEKNNASGLPEHADELRISVQFGQGREEGDSPGETRTVQAYFSNFGLDSKPVADCEAVFPVARTVPRTLAPARAGLEALIAGPTPEERGQGYATNIPEGVEIRSLVIENGVATADFSQELERTGGSCAVAAIRAQIEKTLKQFPTVKSVRISIDGRTEDILQP